MTNQQLSNSILNKLPTTTAYKKWSKGEQKFLLDFCDACQDGNFKKMNKIYNKHQDKIDINVFNGLPIYLAVLNDNAEIVQFLLDRGANVDRRDHALIRMAIIYGYGKIFAILLDKYDFKKEALGKILFNDFLRLAIKYRRYNMQLQLLEKMKRK